MNAQGQQPIKILLVDDEPRNLDALDAILDDPSYVRLRAENADGALKLLLEHDVAAIVLDIKMPGVSGFELAQLIKGTKKFRHIPIVFLTAYMIDEKDVMAGYGSGAVDYLTKPINPLILQHKVAVFADLFRKTRALAAVNEQLERLNQELEARVRERTAELERANRMKDEFLATISHELRTPLNAMLGWATILKQDPGNCQKVSKGVDVIERNAKAQERLIADLLDVSRIISGKLRLNPSRFVLADAIRAAADVVRPAAEAKAVRMVLDLHSELGPTLGDPGRMQQVMWNLLINAVRFSPPGGGTVTVRAKREGSQNVVQVEDNGAGIAAEHLPHIFERFRQVDSSTTRAHGGMGLGLALVRHLVEAHGGTVQAHSEGLGRGATFTVSLPIPAVDVADPDSPESEAAAEADAGATPGPSRPRPELADVRALVVEDDVDSRELLCVVLEGAGACVTTAATATEALSALYGACPFDVIVSDIGLPEMDGYDFMQRIRSDGEAQRVPAIALTAYARGEDVRRAKRAGYQEHLSKPVDPQRLIDVVKSLLCENGTPVGSPGEAVGAAHEGAGRPPLDSSS